MDYKGQELAELLYTYILNFGALLAFLIGYYYESFQYVIVIYATASGIALLLCVPDWPIFNKNKLKWLPPLKKASTEVVKRESG